MKRTPSKAEQPIDCDVWAERWKVRLPIDRVDRVPNLEFLPDTMQGQSRVYQAGPGLIQARVNLESHWIIHPRVAARAKILSCR